MVPSSEAGKMKIKTWWLKRRRQVCSQAGDIQGRAVALCAGTPGQFPLILSGFQFICWDCAHASYSTNVQVLNNLCNLYLSLKLEMRKDLLVFLLLHKRHICMSLGFCLFSLGRWLNHFHWVAFPGLGRDKPLWLAWHSSLYSSLINFLHF